jgi:hypothetical protein
MTPELHKWFLDQGYFVDVATRLVKWENDIFRLKPESFANRLSLRAACEKVKQAVLDGTFDKIRKDRADLN